MDEDKHRRTIKMFIIKQIDEVRVDESSKEEYKKEISFDPGFESLNKGHMTVTFYQKQKEKTSELLALSNYLFLPLKKEISRVS